MRPGDLDGKHLDETEDNCLCIFPAASEREVHIHHPLPPRIICPIILLVRRVHPRSKTHYLDHLMACLYLFINKGLPAESVHHPPSKRDVLQATSVQPYRFSASTRREQELHVHLPSCKMKTIILM